MKMGVGEAQVNQIRCQEQHDDAQKILDKLHNGFIFFVMGHLFKTPSGSGTITKTLC